MKSVSQGAAWNIAATTLPQILTLVLSVILARTLGPNEQGVLSFLIFTATMTSIVFVLGLPLALQRWLAQALGAARPDTLRRLATSALRITVVPALAAFGACLVVGQFYNSDRVSAWYAAAVYAFAATFHGVAAQGLQGLHRFRRATLVSLITQLLSLPASIIALICGAGITEVLWISALAAVASAVVTATLLVRYVYLISREVSAPTCRASYAGAGATESPSERLVRAGTSWTDVAGADAGSEGLGDLRNIAEPFGPHRDERESGRMSAMLRFAALAGVAVLLHTIVVQRSELAFLAIFHPEAPAQIAFYAVAFAAVSAAIQIPMALVPVILPTVTTLLAAGKETAVRTGFEIGQRSLMVISAVASGLLLAVGAPLVKILWGEQYQPAAAVLLIAGVIPVMTASAIAVTTATLMAFNKTRQVVIAQSVAAVFTIGLDIALIPPWGIYGAALANSVGQVALVAALAVAANRAAHLRLTRGSDLVRVVALVLAIGLGGLVSWFLALGTIPSLLVGAIVAVVGVAVGAPLIKPLGPHDLSSVSQKLDSLPTAARKWLIGLARQESTTA